MPEGENMKSFTEYLTLNIPSNMAFVNITPQVAEAVRKSGVMEGLVLCNSMHITSSVFINDDEAGLHHDFGVWLEKLAPFNPERAAARWSNDCLVLLRDSRAHRPSPEQWWFELLRRTRSA